MSMWINESFDKKFSTYGYKSLSWVFWKDFHQSIEGNKGNDSDYELDILTVLNVQKTFFWQFKDYSLCWEKISMIWKTVDFALSNYYFLKGILIILFHEFIKGSYLFFLKAPKSHLGL